LNKDLLFIVSVSMQGRWSIVQKERVEGRLCFGKSIVREKKACCLLRETSLGRNRGGHIGVL